MGSAIAGVVVSQPPIATAAMHVRATREGFTQCGTIDRVPPPGYSS